MQKSKNVFISVKLVLYLGSLFSLKNKNPATEG